METKIVLHEKTLPSLLNKKWNNDGILKIYLDDSCRELVGMFKIEKGIITYAYNFHLSKNETYNGGIIDGKFNGHGKYQTDEFTIEGTFKDGIGVFGTIDFIKEKTFFYGLIQNFIPIHGIIVDKNTYMPIYIGCFHRGMKNFGKEFSTDGNLVYEGNYRDNSYCN